MLLSSVIQSKLLMKFTDNVMEINFNTLPFNLTLDLFQMTPSLINQILKKNAMSCLKEGKSKTLSIEL